MAHSSSWALVSGGITAPVGFQAAGIAAGLKDSGKPDLALVLAPEAAVCAGTFTTSVVRAACVDLCAQRLQASNGQCRGVLINSGQANACTGDSGLIDSQRATQALADLLGLTSDQMLICSTGVIGVPIPMKVLLAGLDPLVEALAEDGGAAAAAAILTTDLVPKQIAVESEIDGRTVRMAAGDRVLETAELELVRAEPDWRTKLLSVITDPNVAYFLMIIGFYGILFELANPGAVVPGVIGAISLILALFAFQVLSVNYAGLALILLGLTFIVGEAFVPSFGILGIGGIVAFVTGSVILMEGSHQDISLPTIGGTAVVAGGFILWTVTRFIGLRRRHPVSGSEQLVHEHGMALDDFVPTYDAYAGHVRVSGERWNARSQVAIAAGAQVRVNGMDGLTLLVEPGDDEPAKHTD